ncbi:carbohydrate ABC transporter permease [Martelella mediterranea]|uniref:Maltose ABC transporter membrane protein /trehalose ABC transporter membrane protein /sucrose ABC transporter membrane protein n=1 Tax=Martelella mediterranea TaxID=293089 RepID=A0A4R3NMB0_9HYPH|nr:sugar ABC transporter permease [Martelella mediterranea]TCT35309.1 maltose ABC transporter membrane protein /trehalose ABC transporter membrane protein /sucrose ABC transporter membrane protein [Martelella mediterranea]
MEQIIKALVAVVIGVAVAVAYFYGSNKLLDLIFPSNTKEPGRGARNLRISGMIRPWLFLGPALLSLSVYLIYPIVASVDYSLHGPAGDQFVGLANYRWMLFDPEFRQSIFNNMLWLIFVPAMSTFFGLVIAWLTDRIWWGSFAKMMIFMPMAISFVGASVIWKFVYDYRGEGADQIGILNAIVVSLGGEPHVWIAMPFWNNFFLMVILLWIQTGFAMVLLSAALRGIPEETIEAAVIDGANGFQIFFKIMIPQIYNTIAVVWTTITIIVLKIFDIVLAMTNGQWNTQVLANLMFDWMFRGGGDFGRGAAIAIVIMVLVIPIMIWNIRNANKEMEGR